MLNFYTSFLARTAVFKGIPAKDIDKAIACLRGFYKSFECGQEIYRSGDIVSHAGIVVEGSVHAEQIGVDGKTVLLKEIGRGESFGEALCCLRQANPFLRIISAEKTKVLFIQLPSEDGTNRCGCPYRIIVLENLLREMARDIQHLNMKIQLLAQPTLRDKLLFYLHLTQNTLHRNSFTLPFTREKLAQFISADRSAVSRELSRMNREGIIQIEGKTITLMPKGTGEQKTDIKANVHDKFSNFLNNLLPEQQPAARKFGIS